MPKGPINTLGTKVNLTKVGTIIIMIELDTKTKINATKKIKMTGIVCMCPLNENTLWTETNKQPIRCHIKKSGPRIKKTIHITGKEM